MKTADDDGQATVELALVLAPILFIALAVLQVGLVWRDQLMVVHAAREGARAAAVGGDESMVRAAALGSTSLDPGRLSVSLSRGSQSRAVVTVTVVYGPPTSLGLFGALLANRRLSAEATMMLEASSCDQVEDLDCSNLVQAGVAAIAVGADHTAGATRGAITRAHQG